MKESPFKHHYRRTFGFWTVIFLLAASTVISPALAEDISGNSDTTGRKNNEKIHITADKLISDNTSGYAEFIGDVRASQGENVITADSSYAAEMAEIVRTNHVGEAVVIVSHSNTVPEIIGELGVSPVPTIDDDEYDDLYVVVIAPGGAVQLLPLRYGPHTP